MPKAFSLSQTKLINVLLAFNLPTDIAYLADEFGDLVNDTRKLNQGDVFCAGIGQQQNGNNYIAKAIESGSSLIIAECEHPEQHGEVCYLVKESSKEIAVIVFSDVDFINDQFAFKNTFFKKVCFCHNLHQTHFWTKVPPNDLYQSCESTIISY